ncbi:hypothetical protein DFAR_3460009 [Desulfarculales bacterium]
MPSYFAACIKKIMELGRRSPWLRPERWLRCGSVRLWGHIFRACLFCDEALKAIWLRRFLCPDCQRRGWIQLRPWGCWSRFQALVETIRQSLPNKLARGRWDPGLFGVVSNFSARDYVECG